MRKSVPGWPAAEGRAAAAAELRRLERFSAALAALPEATCPEPLGLVEEPAPGLRMRRLDGENLVGVLAARELDAGRIARFADTMAAALDACVEATGEPYFDFKFDNVLVAGDTLGFLDLGTPQHWREPDPGWTPHEVSLGNLLASALFEIGRPRHVARVRLRRQAAALATRTVRATQAPLDPAHLSAAAREAYVRATFGRRSPLHSAWYATVGYAAGARLRLDGLTVGPVPVWRA